MVKNTCTPNKNKLACPNDPQGCPHKIKQEMKQKKTARSRPGNTANNNNDDHTVAAINVFCTIRFHGKRVST